MPSKLHIIRLNYITYSRATLKLLLYLKANISFDCLFFFLFLTVNHESCSRMEFGDGNFFLLNWSDMPKSQADPLVVLTTCMKPSCTSEINHSISFLHLVISYWSVYLIHPFTVVSPKFYFLTIVSLHTEYTNTQLTGVSTANRRLKLTSPTMHSPTADNPKGLWTPEDWQKNKGVGCAENIMIYKIYKGIIKPPSFFLYH